MIPQERTPLNALMDRLTRIRKINLSQSQWGLGVKNLRTAVLRRDFRKGNSVQIELFAFERLTPDLGCADENVEAWKRTRIHQVTGYHIFQLLPKVSFLFGEGKRADIMGHTRGSQVLLLALCSKNHMWYWGLNRSAHMQDAYPPFFFQCPGFTSGSVFKKHSQWAQETIWNSKN